MKAALPHPCLALVTDRHLRPQGDLVERVAMAVDGGVGMVELRERDLPAGELLALALRLREVTAGRALLVVNDRADVARACAADGVHLPEAGLTVAAARQIMGPGMLVGRSVHSAAGAREAAEAGADYLIVGTIFPSPSKPGVPPAGVALLEAVAAQVELPFLAIGGVTAQNAASVIVAGAWGAAVISAILASPAPGVAARELLRELRAHAVARPERHEPSGERKTTPI
ncbi:MAG: thiamine phosphate synthase [Dehalococcoidia bacterium]|nr:thiamine phosphate synthase [Dehalococcoidia bacterium]